MTLRISKSAWQRLSRIQSTRPRLSVVRLTNREGKPVCHSGRHRSSDLVIEQPGCPTVLMTPEVAAELTDMRLHAPKSQSGRRLRLKQA